MVIEKIQASGAKAKAVPAKAEKAGPAKTEKKATAKKTAAKPAAKKATPKKAETTDYSKLTVAQLKEEAKNKGIEGISSMKKADLIAALSK